MTTIKVNNEEYNVPSSWSDVTIAQQIEIAEMVNRDDQFRNLHMISTYTGIPIELVKKMNINQFKSILNIMTFLSEPIKNEVIKSFTFDGHEYFIAPSILAGETQDFLSVEGLMNRFKDNQTKALPYIIAVIAKRKGETLDNYDPWTRGEQFKNLPYSVAHNIWFFFAQTEAILSIDIKQFLAVQDKTMEASLSYSAHTLKKLDGLPLSKRLLRAILLLYMRFISKSYRSFSTGIQSTYLNKNLKKPSLMNRLSNLVKRVRDKFK